MKLLFFFAFRILIIDIGMLKDESIIGRELKCISKVYWTDQKSGNPEKKGEKKKSRENGIHVITLYCCKRHCCPYTYCKVHEA